MATKESEDMESLCLQQNRRFHILPIVERWNIGFQRLGVVLLKIFAGLSLQTQPNRFSILDYAQPMMYSENFALSCHWQL